MKTSSSAQPEMEDAQARNNNRDDNQQNQNIHATLDSADTVDNGGNTVLHLAVRKNMVERCKLALQDTSYRAMVNSKNKDGETPLHISCVERNRIIAEVLLANGAGINAIDNLGLTPLHCAIIAQGIFEESEESDRPEDTSLVELLLAHKKLDKNIKTFHQGATALHLAAAWALPDIVALLLKGGADRHSTTWRGEISLHWAFRTMREDEANYPKRMIPYLDGTYAGDSGHHGLDDDIPATSNLKIARYGQKLIAAFDIQTEQERWGNLLRIAYREKDESMVRYSAHRLYPRRRQKEKELVTLWLAMRPERFDTLKEELLNNIAAEKRGEWRSRNVLDLAAHQGLYEVVKWLLKSNLWTKGERKDAEGRVPDEHRSPKWETVWDIPFLQDGRKEDENYRYPQENDDNQFTTEFQSSVFNFYSIGRYSHFLHHLCNVRELLYNGEKGPVRIMDEKATAFKENFPEINTEAYDDSNLRFRWVHLPVNCMEWMKDATTSSFKDKKKNPDYFTATNQFLLHSWHELPGNSDKDKYMNPTCLRKGIPSMRTPQPGDNGVSDQLALYMPYITFSRPTYKTETEKRLQSAEEVKTRIIHRPKTLDTYHLGTTDDEKARVRDSDQVVFRHFSKNVNAATRKQGHERILKNHEIPIVHIGQLWLWVIDEDTVVTTETHDSHSDSSPIFRNVLNYLNDNRGQLGRDIIPQSLDSFVNFITSFYINTPFNLTISLPLPIDNDDKRESLHDIFLSSIERVNSEEGRLRSKFKQEMYDQDEGKKIDGDKTMHSSVTETIELLSEIKDIKQELNIISSVILAQSKVWEQLTNRPRALDKPVSASRDSEGTGGAGTAEYVLRRISGLLRFAEETQENIESILDLKMNQLSLLQAEEAGRQGTTLMVFTTVTVLFAPLSFLSALFALNISIFPHSGTDLLYEPGWLFGILFGVTIAIGVIILVYVYRHKFIIKKAKKTPRKEPSSVTEHLEEAPGNHHHHHHHHHNNNQPRNRSARLKIPESRAFKVWEKVQGLRARTNTGREILPIARYLSDK
ncbi:hypothetical protein F5B17DRAFT_404459 [Nemania serpens]|nr:hypothetical protein F5B17DRAFT_404459 [Nemania serpens]